MDQSHFKKFGESRVTTDTAPLPFGINNAETCNQANSLSSSMIEQMFDEVNRAQFQEQNSSLSVLDLDAIDDDQNLFMLGSNAPISPHVHLRSLACSLRTASPIPLSGHSVFPTVAETPARIPKDVTFEIGVSNGGSSAMSSLLTQKTILASTPFHKRSISSNFDDDLVQSETTAANETYNLNDKNPAKASSSSENHLINVTYNEPRGGAAQNVGDLAINVTYNEPRPDLSAHVTDSRVLNETYNGPPRPNNVTFTASNEPGNNATFNKTSTEIPSHQTFEVANALDKVPQKGPTATKFSRLQPSHVPLKDESTVELESKDSVQRQPLRKPLSALSNATNSRIKPPASRQSQKRLSRLISPRMNTTTLNRIQANSPQKSSEETRKENIKLSHKPLQPIEKPKTLVKGKIASRTSIIEQKSPSTLSSNHSVTHAASSKSTNRRSKSEASLAKPVRRSTAHKLRTTSSSNLTTVNESKLQKPLASTSGVRSSGSSINSLKNSTSKPRDRKSQNKDFELRKSEKVSIHNDQESQCVVAMATLLDYVVNQIQGLSAPKLSIDKQRLKISNEKQSQCIVDLTSRVNHLQQALDQSRSARDHDVKAAVERHRVEIGKIKEENKTSQSELNEELIKTNEELTQQERNHEGVLKALRAEHRRTIEQLNFKHREDIATLEQEWKEKCGVLEKERNSLEEQMNNAVEDKVGEMIQPYVSSFEEKESLKAVLEMKKNEQQKLMEELSRRCDQTDEARALTNLVSVLQQKNEDLQTQINKRNTELRNAKRDSFKLQRHLAEQQNQNQQLQCRVEELNYRLNTTPPPLSPFNPVFTQSPCTEKHPNFLRSNGSIKFSDKTFNNKDRNRMTSQSEDISDVTTHLPNIDLSA